MSNDAKIVMGEAGPAGKSKKGFPLISIGLVVLDGSGHVRAALDSVIGQSYRNIELIVVDGGSTDGTLEILDEYREHIAILVSEPDKGIYDAMNKACTLATGDWLLFLGCDDELLDTLGDMAMMMEDRDAVYYGDVIFRSTGKIYGGKSSKLRVMEYNICHQSLLYPKTVYQRYAYDLKYQWYADYLYNLTLMGCGIRFVYTGVVVSIFNDKGRSLVGDADFQRDQLKLIASTLGPAYAWLEHARKIARAGLKRLIPSQVWEYCRSLYSSRKGH